MSFLKLLLYDFYERHSVVSQLLREAIGSDQGDVCILDVGGRAELLERFALYRVVSVNVDGSSNLLASGCALPFVDSSFVAVVSIDTLEHLPRESRSLFLRECLRVAQHYVVIAAPFGTAGHSECEKRLDNLYRSVHGKPLVHLSEHVRYGLPDAVELNQFACELEAANIQRFFAGDYVWQGKQFERAVLGHRKKGLLARLWNAYNHIASLALFHPIRLRDQPNATTNRFYLLVEKKHRGYLRK